MFSTKHITTMDAEKISQLLSEVAPAASSSMIIDPSVTIKSFAFCCISAKAQHLEYRTQRLSAFIDSNLEKRILDLTRQPGQPYMPLYDESIIEEMEKAPKHNTESFLDSTKRKMNELMEGGRNMSHSDIILQMDNGYIAERQPRYLIRKECKVSACPYCNGTGTVEQTDKMELTTIVECSECKGNGSSATLTWVVPKVATQQEMMVRSLEPERNDIEMVWNGTSFVIPGTTVDIPLSEIATKRMLTHLNGTDNENFDEELLPYLDMIHDVIGDENALEEIGYRLVPCYTFGYRKALGGELRSATLVDPNGFATLIMSADTAPVRDRVKKIAQFLGKLGKTKGFNDKQDLRRTVRLLIAVCVADGIVRKEEKQVLITAIEGISRLTTGEQASLSQLLTKEDSSFLTDDDFGFHDKENATRTLSAMKEIAISDGEYHSSEIEIIERLSQL